MKRIITALVATCVMACGSCDRAPAGDVPEQGTTSGGHAPACPTFAPRSSVGDETDADRTVHRLDEIIDFHRTRHEKTGSWTDLEAVSSAYMSRARLTSDVADYLAARDALDEAFAAAEESTGPFLTRASYHMLVHQVDDVPADLDRYERRLLLTDADRAAVEGLRGDTAFHHGRLDDALTHYEAAEELDPTTASAGRLANYMLRTARFDDAREYYTLASSRVQADPGKKAWAELHRGIVELERNDVAAADRLYADAEEKFSGWYLIEEHRAEAALLLGDTERAIDMYHDILTRVPNGEFFAALGDAHTEAGQTELAACAYEEARAAFERDIARLPGAASGHALDFYLAHDCARALELAESNFELRPGHQARVKLAMALLANDRRDDAAEVLRPTAQSEWATLDFHAIAALVFESEEAQEYERLANEIDGTAVDALDQTLSTCSR